LLTNLVASTCPEAAKWFGLTTLNVEKKWLKDFPYHVQLSNEQIGSPHVEHSGRKNARFRELVTKKKKKTPEWSFLSVGPPCEFL